MSGVEHDAVAAGTGDAGVDEVGAVALVGLQAVVAVVQDTSEDEGGAASTQPVGAGRRHCGVDLVKGGQQGAVCGHLHDLVASAQLGFERLVGHGVPVACGEPLDVESPA